MSDLPFIVVGAGIAGLTLALSLARRGREVIVLERTARLAEVGAGLQLSPNASRVLLDLGLGPDLAATAVEPDAIVVRSAADGRVVVRLPLRPGMRERYGAPFLVAHRGDLQAALLAAVGREPRISVRLGATVSAAAPRSAGGPGVEVAAVLADGAARLDADALFGADGVRSSVRTLLMEGPGAAYSGRTAWRATFQMSEWTGDPAVVADTGLWLGSGAHLVHYPIQGGAAVNVVAAVDEPWQDDVWDVAGDPGRLAAVFAAWPEPARRLVGIPGRWRKWALCAVPDEGAWARGRIALLGDAAHAMLPFVAQGGGMAIEDAAVLARLATDAARPMEARLAAYERLRRPRATAVAATARRNGTIYHLAGPAAAARDLAMRMMGPRGLLERMHWIYGWRDDAGT